jgi:hypothetical protein
MGRTSEGQETRLDRVARPGKLQRNAGIQLDASQEPPSTTAAGGHVDVADGIQLCKDGDYLKKVPKDVVSVLTRVWNPSWSQDEPLPRFASAQAKRRAPSPTGR